MSGRTVEELADLVDRHTPDVGEHTTAIEALTLFRCVAPSEPTLVVYQPSLCLIARGRKQVLLAGVEFAYDPGHYLLASVDLPVTGQVIEASAQAPYLGIRIVLDPRQVAELVADMASEVPPSPVCGLVVSPVDSGLMDAVTRLVGLLDRPGELAVLAPLVMREITFRLIAGEQGARLRQIAGGDGRARRIARAIRWLRNHFAEPFLVEEIAREARMSVSAFHHQFKAVTAMTPIQFQKQLRLQEARRLMLGEGLDAAAAGYRVGYESPSQFSREYRRQFGRPPRLDLAALRLTPQA